MTKVFVVLSGVGDRPCRVLDGKTPLEAAKTKNLDFFANESNFGYVYPISRQVAPKGHESMLALLGYDLSKYNISGGPIEAYGSGVDYRNGWLALRTNFASVKENNIVDRRVGRSLTTREALELTRAVNEKVKLNVPFVFKHTFSHEGVLVFKEKLSSNISNVDPAYRSIGKYGVSLVSGANRLQECRALDPDTRTKLSARLVNEFVSQSRIILEEHKINKSRKNEYLLPANSIVPRDAGNFLPELPERIGWNVIASANYVIGVARLAGMKIIWVENKEIREHDIYSYLFSILKQKIKVFRKTVKERGSGNYFVHFNEVDICGHDNKPKEKKKMIEIIDKKLFKFLKDVDDLELVVAGDHSTPCEIKCHSADPVPFMHYGLAKSDNVKRFTEKDALNGYYGRLIGKEAANTISFL